MNNQRVGIELGEIYIRGVKVKDGFKEGVVNSVRYSRKLK